ncbi:MAG: hypothetical protein KA821_06970 [Chitinophagaceae bacterium]|nr:hypothetical protein [Chitinophagaceae bacterium]
MFLLDIPISSLTDWISAIAAAIGIPLAFLGFIKLIQKDKDKQAQLNSLKEIAEYQKNINSQLQEQVGQLTIQSGEFQYQSSLMFESNQLLEKQIGLFSNYFQDRRTTESEKYELEQQKRVLEIKPHFIFAGGSSSPGYFQLKLKNNGGTAQKFVIERTNAEFAIINDVDQNVIIESGQILTLKGSANSEKTYWNGNTVNYEINLQFTDVDGNVYYQRIKRLNHNYMIDNPVLRSKK